MARKDHIVDTPWSSLSMGDRIRHLEVEGYVVIPDILPLDLVGQLRDELSRVSTVGTDYTDKKQTANDIQWSGGALIELIAKSNRLAQHQSGMANTHTNHLKNQRTAWGQPLPCCPRAIAAGLVPVGAAEPTANSQQPTAAQRLLPGKTTAYRFTRPTYSFRVIRHL